MVDFVWIILPVELIITAWNVQSPYFYVVTWVAIVTLVVHIISTKIHSRTQILELFLATQMDKCPCVSYIRAFTNIITGFCIFAADFIIYPKYFYKSRLYGTTLMDLGLGFYVISHAMVANEARGIFLKARWVPCC
ncbi:hypothetical protein DPMN_055106 [Dreissena polymorpha]|uniref:Uncharacterized protein n=1 Tax=Dreissena polymorpha TaxID=45954 RepID=A0A9D4CRP8_DREPO|nr:hypothetical protein DPMN_055106 [Dreissena polymorpha]